MTSIFLPISVSVRKSFSAVGIAVVMTFLLAGCQAPPQSVSWRATLRRDLPLYGDRNWIAIVDSAYPDQSRAGVDTVVTHRGMFTVLQNVLAGIHSASNIRAEAYTDKELNYVTSTQVPGIRAYRKRLYAMLKGVRHSSRMHIKSIDRLNAEGKIFNILILKTNLTMPYTSVFIHLKCGYWTDADETALRKAMASASAE
jgi:hypothetical protein